MENASRRYTYSDVQNLIENQKEKYGWEFLFLGANIDAPREARRFGISEDRSVTYKNDKEGVSNNFGLLGSLMEWFIVKDNESDDFEYEKEKHIRSMRCKISEDVKKRGK